MNRSFADRLAVCSWSLQPATPQQLMTQLKEIGVPRVQIALDPIREQPAVWGPFPELASAAGIQIVSGMFGCIGEDYTTMESIRRTGGIVPDSTWAENWKNIQRTSELANAMKLGLVSFHAGFLPEEKHDPDYTKLIQRLRQVADAFGARGIQLALETGQETAQVLRNLLTDLDRGNVGVNFDPANMILYAKGSPIEALQVLRPWLKQCHIKDARQTKVPGTWGDEVVSGTGEVPWNEFFSALNKAGFRGWCAIEREAGNQRLADIRAARQYVESLAI
jgi:L-ribulose-5-phosphate 3-epimerase